MNKNVIVKGLARGLLSAGILLATSGQLLAQELEKEEGKDPKRWKTTAALAAAMTRGNSDTASVSGSVDTLKKWSGNELGFGAGFIYGEETDQITASAATGYGQYNRLISERFYFYGRADALHDDIADIAYRVTLSPGAGYYFIKNEKFTLSGELGPGYVLEKFHNVDMDDYLTMRLSENFTWDITESSRLWQSAAYNPQIDQWDNFFFEAEVGVATKITASLDLRVVCQYTHRSHPAAGRKQDDFRLLAGVGYTF